MVYRVEVLKRKRDPEASSLKHKLKELGISGPVEVQIVRVYFLNTPLPKSKVEEIARGILSDSVTEEYKLQRIDLGPGYDIEVWYNPGVTDPSAESIEKALRDANYRVEGVRTAKRYHFKGKITRQDIKRVSQRLLYNPLIQHPHHKGESPFSSPPPYRFYIRQVKITEKSDRALLNLSRKHQLSLTLEEMRAIQNYYRSLNREPTDIELETFAQTWSEHCKHKTFRGEIDYEGEVITDLLKSTIFKVTEELNPPWCLSVFKDNSGVIEFDNQWAISFKVETHNHPSALEPYGGAATGIGGVIRDCLGVGRGAKPIMNTDIFCFAPPNFPYEKVPKGVLHPKRVLKGVVSGVRDYGNRMGIPTANGTLYFDEGFLCNPLVFCGTLGIMPKDMVEKEIKPDDLIVLVGGRTGRDGIHGVTFASTQLTRESEEVSSSAVQIGNPIEEKKLTDLILEARDRGLFNGITDCGGGGLSSAIGEMVAPLGGIVELDRVPLKYEGLSYTEIWISESQERMVLFLPENRWKEFEKLAKRYEVEATPIGRVGRDKTLILKYKEKEVGRIDLDFLHKGWPRIRKKAVSPKPPCERIDLPGFKNLSPILLEILGSFNVASKEWIVRQYDHEVQGTSVIKPLVDDDIPNDATVIKPIKYSDRGVVISCGIKPRYGLLDPYWMAASSIDEALRNLIAVGGSLKRVALLDNFCWASPDDPEQLGGLVMAARACYDIGIGYKTPFISGKDSLYNEFKTENGRTIPIPPTLLISAVGIIEDVKKTITMDIKSEGSYIYILGLTYEELGGSEYLRIFNSLKGKVPRVDPVRGRRLMSALSSAIRRGLVLSCHDLSEGGLGIAIAEMVMGGDKGVEIHLSSIPLGEEIERDDFILFSESNTRFLVEIEKKHQKEFEEIMKRCDFSIIGETDNSQRLRIYDRGGRKIIDLSTARLKKVWKEGLSRWLE